MNRRLTAIVVAAIVVSACGGDDQTTQTEGPAVTSAPVPSSTVAPRSSTTASAAPPTTSAPDSAAPAVDGVRRVPGDYDTIQDAVDAAAPGELVLIDPGTYRESVDVTTDRIVIRGVDRDTVVLDGELDLDNGIRVLAADGVAVENVTIRNYTNNWLFWLSSQGYRASYVTTYRTGNYGIYAFDSVEGLIEHSHTVGSRDAGIYIGQCFPCDAVVTDVVSSFNGLGFSGTNAGGNLLIVESDWHDNRIGLVPNSGSYELCPPQRAVTIVGNRVWSNNSAESASISYGILAQGNGILVAGGIGNAIERNRVDDHRRSGIGLIQYTEDAPLDDLPTRDEWELTCAEQRTGEFVQTDGPIFWESFENVVRDNVVTNSGEADLVVASVAADISTLGHCFEGNEFATSAPVDIETLAPCGGDGAGDWTAGEYPIARWVDEQSSLPPEVAWQDVVLPELGPHDGLPDAATTPPRPAVDGPPVVDLDAITVPELSTD